MSEVETHELNGIRADHHFKTDTILLSTGPLSYGIYEEGIIKRRVTVEGSGKILRVSIEGINGYVDINLEDIVDRAVEMLVR